MKLNLSTILEDRSPKLGVYWIHDGEVISFAKNYKDVPPNHGFRDSPYNHDPLWDKVVSQHPDLKNSEYFEIPRGRVMQNLHAKKFIVLTSKNQASDPNVRKAIEREFSLPPSLVEWRTDFHYEIDPHIDWD